VEDKSKAVNVTVSQGTTYYQQVQQPVAPFQVTFPAPPPPRFTLFHPIPVHISQQQQVVFPFQLQQMAPIQPPFYYPGFPLTAPPPNFSYSSTNQQRPLLFPSSNNFPNISLPPASKSHDTGFLRQDLQPQPSTRTVLNCFSYKELTSMLKTKIYAFITFRAEGFKGLNPDLGTGLYSLHENSHSLSLTSAKHLKWLLEFYIKNPHNQSFYESYLDYFEYIKKYHLIPEMRYDPEVRSVIKHFIISFISCRCALPEVIRDLLEMYQGFIRPDDLSDSVEFYTQFKTSLAENETIMTARAENRYITTLEHLLEYLPVPYDVVLLETKEAAERSRVARLLLHFAPLFHLFLSREAIDNGKITEAIGFIYQFANGTRLERLAASDQFWIPSILNIILKRFNLNLNGQEQDRINEALDRYDQILPELIKFYTTEDFFLFLRNRLDFLVDAYIYAENLSGIITIGFVPLVLVSWEAYKELDLYFSLGQISMFLSQYKVSLQEFRTHFKDILIERMVGAEHFLLVLEALLAAVDGIVGGTFVETWEPTREFLLLQEEILSISLDEKDKALKYSILKAPFLFLAAKIVFCRQSGYPISMLGIKLPLYEFSWKDAIDYVNHFQELCFPCIFKKIEIRSEFWKVLAGSIEDNADFAQIIRLFDANEYKTKQIFIPEVDDVQEEAAATPPPPPFNDASQSADFIERLAESGDCTEAQITESSLKKISE